jgi:hypothetical protein
MTEQQPTGASAPGVPEVPVPEVPAPDAAVPAVAPDAVTAPVVPVADVSSPDAAPAAMSVPVPTETQVMVAAADAAPVPVVAPAPEAPAPPVQHRRKRDRILGTTGQVIGVVGIIVCLALVLGVVFARGYAVSMVDDVTANIDTQIAKVNPILLQANSTVGEISGKVSTVADIAAGIAADPTPGGDIAQTLRNAISGVNERYQALREGYAGIRETALSIIDKLQTLDRIIPGLAIPQGPIDALNTFDANLQQFDAKVNDLLTIEPGTGPANQAAAKIAEAATAIDSRLQAVQDGITQVDDRVTQLRTDVKNTAGTVNMIINVVTVFIVLLLLYMLVLHWVLFRHSGEIRTKRVAG